MQKARYNRKALVVYFTAYEKQALERLARRESVPMATLLRRMAVQRMRKVGLLTDDAEPVSQT